jgi:hypothetical protein
MSDCPVKTLTYEHRYYRDHYPIKGTDYIINQYKRNQITKELAVRRLYQSGVQNPLSLLDKGFEWELDN